MKIEHLNEFLVLCDSMNYSKAAKTLFMSQPSLSTHIQNLEKEVGTALIERGDRRIRLTECGKIFLENAQIIVKQHERMIEEIQSEILGAEKVLLVGFLRKSFCNSAQKMVRSAESAALGTRISLRSGGYVELQAALAKNELDVIFTVDCDESLHGSYNIVRLGFETVFFAAPRKIIPSHVSERGFLLAEEIGDYPVLAPSATETGKYAAWLRTRMSELNAKPNIVGHFLDPDLRYFEMIDKNSGCFLMSDFAQTLDSETFEILPINSPEGTDLMIPLAAIWKKSNRSAAIADIVSIMKGLCGSKGFRR